MTDLVDLVELAFQPDDAQCTLLKKQKKKATFHLTDSLAVSRVRPVDFRDSRRFREAFYLERIFWRRKHVFSLRYTAWPIG